jgi:hypothetical protein
MDDIVAGLVERTQLLSEAFAPFHFCSVQLYDPQIYRTCIQVSDLKHPLLDRNIQSI